MCILTHSCKTFLFPFLFWNRLYSLITAKISLSRKQQVSLWTQYLKLTCINLTLLGRGYISWGIPSLDWPMALSVRHFLNCYLICEGPAHYGWWNPWAVIPRFHEKGEWTLARGSKPLSISLPRSPLLIFIQNSSRIYKMKQTYTFFLKLLSGMVLKQQRETGLEQNFIPGMWGITMADLPTLFWCDGSFVA